MQNFENIYKYVQNLENFYTVLNKSTKFEEKNWLENKTKQNKTKKQKQKKKTPYPYSSLLSSYFCVFPIKCSGAKYFVLRFFFLL